MRVYGVADDLRPDEDDELGALHRLVLVRERVTEQAGQLIEHRNAVAPEVLRLADETGEQHGLAVGDAERAAHFALRDGRGQQAGRISVGDVADLLLDNKQEISIASNPNTNNQ